jgi:hypothetical protein
MVRDPRIGTSRFRFLYSRYAPQSRVAAIRRADSGSEEVGVCGP